MPTSFKQEYLGFWINERTKLKFQKKCLDNKKDMSLILRELIALYILDDSILRGCTNETDNRTTETI